jgi:hypothetical protein
LDEPNREDFVGKNILIFSDGTGQAGGIAFDEDRTNIYKLYRATRCGPDSLIHPDEQVASYDPGLGSPQEGGFVWGKAGRWIYNAISQATGLGITANIIDCYAAIIRLYREGDRIFLFGFSRGAYTVRSLAAVLAKCGVPRCLPNGDSVPLDIPGSRRLAAKAVKDVYQFCTSRARSDVGFYGNFMLNTRERIAARFRFEHQSYAMEDLRKCDPKNAAEFNPSDPGRANVYPYFIGVFDTVAAVGRPLYVVGIVGAFLLLLSGISAAAIFLVPFGAVPYVGWIVAWLTPKHVFWTLFAVVALAMGRSIAQNYLKCDFRVPGYGLLKSVATIHPAATRFKFAEYTLSPHVEYAKHAVSIDENRSMFKRVNWQPEARRKDSKDEFGNIHFEQVWFPGVHADIGGGYPENESRLSDSALHWMLAAASMIPDGIKHDETVLRLYPHALGPQHDEYKAGKYKYGLRDLPIDKKTGKVISVIVHKSVYPRFKARKVVQYDTEKEYRPPNFEHHADFAHYYVKPFVPSNAPTVAFATDIERAWERQKARTDAEAMARDVGNMNT